MLATLTLSFIAGPMASPAPAVAIRVYELETRKWHWECPDCRQGKAPWLSISVASTATVPERPTFSPSTISTNWSRCWRAWQRSGEGYIGRLATLLRRSCPIRKRLDDRENHDLPTIDFADAGQLAC